MMARRKVAIEHVDITHLAELRRLAEEVRERRESRVLRVGDEDLALLVPLPRPPHPGEETVARAAFEAVMKAAGGWRGIVDTEQLKEEINASRGSDRTLGEV